MRTHLLDNASHKQDVLDECLKHENHVQANYNLIAFFCYWHNIVDKNANQQHDGLVENVIKVHVSCAIQVKMSSNEC